jgi:hypothetical protein
MIFYLLGLLSYYKIAKKPVPFGICFSFFLVVIIPPISTLYILLSKHWIFQVLAFIVGLFCWTFIEYSFNRFWKYKINRLKYNHKYFFQNANLFQSLIIKIKWLSIIAVTVLLIYASFEVNIYLLLPAGIFSGFTVYNFICVSLRKKSQLNKLSTFVKLHRLNYSGLSENCFGITVTWWDSLFGTMPVKKKKTQFEIKKEIGENL